jgi:hypothetical protein
MFWSDWGAKPQIVRAGMDGTEVTPFVATGVVWPNGLALDYPLNDLYWVDAKLDRIEAIHIDGSNRRVSTVYMYPPALCSWTELPILGRPRST